MNAITEPGAYKIEESAYHADPCPEPSLSTSIAKVLLGKSPRHAKTQHPRLNPNFTRTTRKEFDLGSAAHALMLGSHEKFVRIDAKDFRTKDAKAARDAAYEFDHIPLLEHQWTEVERMVAAGRAQLEVHEDARNAFTDGTPEVVLIWQEGGVWCRCMLDWKPNSSRVFYDYKTTGQSANPDDFQSTFYNLTYDVQCAFYRRGIRAVLGVEDPVFEFVVQETADPFALSVVGITPAAVDLADRKVDEALNLWRWCLQNDTWPGYPNRTAYIEPPIWAEKKWLEREERDALGKEGDDPSRLYKTMMDWYAPHKAAE